MQRNLHPFHLAIPVKELDSTRRFYTEILGFDEGRSSERWVDLNFFGHQVVLHLNERLESKQSINPVDGHDVPVPHFGVVLNMNAWKDLAERLERLRVKFVIEPHIRFEGQSGEQATMFFLDPSGNALEFKAMKKPENLFTR